MKRMVKGFLAIFLVITLSCMSFSFTVAAADLMASQDDPLFAYTVLDDGTVSVSFNYLIDDSETIRRMVSEREGVLNIPATLDGYTVSTIAEFGFYMYGGMHTVILPNTVKHIEAYAFDDSSLECIFLPQGLETISYRITCTPYLKEIVIPSTVTEIDMLAFGTAPPTGDFLIPGSVDIVEDFVYYSYNNPCAIAAAEEMGFQHVDLGQFLPGDTNRDDEVNMTDAFAMYKVASGDAIGDPVGNCLGDMNQDGQNDMRDAMAVYTVASGE